MTDQGCQPVSVSRTIQAPAGTLFRLLSETSNHLRIDGSGMLRDTDGTVVTGLGDSFAVQMHNDEMGSYEMTNHVVAFEPDRKLAWEPVMSRAGRPEDEDGVGERAGYQWRYDLDPQGPGATLVTETYDCTRAPGWLQRAVKCGTRWTESMTRTLEKLDALSQG